jgi:serine/threonine protein kinase
VTNGQVVAVKAVNLAEQERSTIENEVRLQRELVHPKLVQIIRVLLYDNRLYIVMEYVDGGMLTDILTVCNCAESHIAYV